MGGYAGAASTAVGQGVNAYGQSEAAHAMSRAWQHQAKNQTAAMAAERAQQAQMIQNLGAGGVPWNTGAQQAQEAQMGAAANAMARGAVAVGARKTGGASAAAPVGGANLQAILGRAGQDAHLQSILEAITNQQRGVDILGRTMQTNVGGIRGDAQRQFATMPFQIAAAGQQGGIARTIGNEMGLGGQIAMNYAMAQPKAPGNAPLPADQLGGAQTPNGGWAASRTYHNSDGSTGAYS